MLAKTHSSIIMGLLTAVEYLPTAIFGLTIGPIFDIYARRKIMLFSLIMQTILVLAAPLLVLKSAPISFNLLVVFLFGTFDLITWTGYQIFIAESVDTQELASASGKVGLISSIQKTFGPGIAAWEVHSIFIAAVICLSLSVVITIASSLNKLKYVK